MLPDWSPVKVPGGYRAPLDVGKAARAARAGVPIAYPPGARYHHHECTGAARQLFAGIAAARNRYAEFFGLGCDCFAL